MSPPSSGRRISQAINQRESRRKQSHGILLSFSLFEHLGDKTFTTYRSIYSFPSEDEADSGEIFVKTARKDRKHTARTFFLHFNYEMERLNTEIRLNPETVPLIIKGVCTLDNIVTEKH
jgi:hypothetical protein